MRAFESICTNAIFVSVKFIMAKSETKNSVLEETNGQNTTRELNAQQLQITYISLSPTIHIPLHSHKTNVSNHSPTSYNSSSHHIHKSTPQTDSHPPRPWYNCMSPPSSPSVSSCAGMHLPPFSHCFEQGISQCGPMKPVSWRCYCACSTRQWAVLLQ